MKFEERPPSHPSVAREWWAGKYGIFQLMYTFGQKRIQVCYNEPHFRYPDGLAPEF